MPQAVYAVRRGDRDEKTFADGLGGYCLPGWAGSAFVSHNQQLVESVDAVQADYGV